MKKEFLSKIVDIQSTLNAPKGQRNSFGNYNYRSCEDILLALKPLLKSHDLVQTINDDMVCVGSRYYIKATISVTDGEDTLTVNSLARESETKKGMDEAQITGSASSYARKYALNGMWCIDDCKDPDTDEFRKNTIANAKATVEKITITPNNERMWQGAINAYKRDGNFDMVVAKANISQDNQQKIISIIKGEAE